MTEEVAKTENGIKKDGIGESDPFYKTENELTNKTDNKESDNASGALTCKQTYYDFVNTPTTYCKNEKFYELIFGTNSYYWLASRFVDCYSDWAEFGLRYVEDDYLGGDNMFISAYYPVFSSCYLRPVVTLKSNIKITKCEGENNENNMHTLSNVE